jgi:hypothetical protein
MKRCGAANSLTIFAAASAASMLAVVVLPAGQPLLARASGVVWAEDAQPLAVSSATLSEVAADSSSTWEVLPSVPSPAATPVSSYSPTRAPSPSTSLSPTLSRTSTVMVPQSSEAPDDTVGSGTPLTTTEIPQAVPTDPSSADDAELNSASPGEASHPNVPVDYDNGAIRYEGAPVPDSTLSGMQDFMGQDDLASPLGIEVREDRRKVDSGEEAEGLLIVGILPNSAAAHAGLRAYSRKVRDALETAAVGAAMIFPPAVLLMPVLDQVPLGEGYDLIIAVDGTRVTNFLDFEDRTRDVQPGEIVYLGIVRDGRRMQVPVKVPSPLPGPLF